MKKENRYRGFPDFVHMPKKVSLDEIEEKIEQTAREEEADNIVLAEDKRD